MATGNLNQECAKCKQPQYEGRSYYYFEKNACLPLYEGHYIIRKPLIDVLINYYILESLGLKMP